MSQPATSSCRLRVIAAAGLLLGGLAWLLKLVAIAATGRADAGASVAFLFLGLVLLAAGAAAAASLRAARRPAWQRWLLGTAGVVALLALFAVADAASRAAIDHGTMREETSILVTALLALGAGAALARTRRVAA